MEEKKPARVLEFVAAKLQKSQAFLTRAPLEPALIIGHLALLCVGWWCVFCCGDAYVARAPCVTAASTACVEPVALSPLAVVVVAQHVDPLACVGAEQSGR